jgi:hypothetical protein
MNAKGGGVFSPWHAGAEMVLCFDSEDGIAHCPLS